MILAPFTQQLRAGHRFSLLSVRTSQGRNCWLWRFVTMYVCDTQLGDFNSYYQQFKEEEKQQKHVFSTGHNGVDSHASSGGGTKKAWLCQTTGLWSQLDSKEAKLWNYVMRCTGAQKDFPIRLHCDRSSCKTEDVLFQASNPCKMIHFDFRIWSSPLSSFSNSESYTIHSNHPQIKKKSGI